MTRAPGGDAGLMEQVAAQRRELATLLGGLAPQMWDRPSLCAAWRVRDVVAHMTMPFRYSTRRFLTEMIKASGNWSFGAGTPVTGSAQDLALVLCARKLPDGLLGGVPSARFTASQSRSLWPGFQADQETGTGATWSLCRSYLAMARHSRR